MLIMNIDSEVDAFKAILRAAWKNNYSKLEVDGWKMKLHVKCDVYIRVKTRTSIFSSNFFSIAGLSPKKKVFFRSFLDFFSLNNYTIKVIRLELEILKNSSIISISSKSQFLSLIQAIAADLFSFFLGHTMLINKIFRDLYIQLKRHELRNIEDEFSHNIYLRALEGTDREWGWTLYRK